jgi:hypothetical protein
MKNFGRWSLAVAVLAIFGWVSLRTLPARAPTAISKPSAGVNPWPVGADDRITLVPRTSEVHAPTKQAPKKDWVGQFHAAGSNYFEFITRAAQAAYEGDGAAQYYIGRALARCEETNALYQDADSADEAVARLAFSPALLELEREEYLDCSKFRSDSPFKGLPERPGGYPSDYWRSRAIESRYPVAMVAAALESPANYAPQVTAAALATGNTEAMLLFGWKHATADKARMPASIMGAAWVLAACRNGANCGPTNDALPFFTCRAGIELGCTERHTAIDELTTSLSSQDLDQANLLAQDIQTSLQYRDPSQLIKYLPF